MNKPIPSQEYLVGLFDYSPITGLLYRKVRRGHQHVGTPVGTTRGDGYRVVDIHGKKFKTSRIIWRMVTGDDPGDMDVDHANRIRDNDAWHNLRLLDKIGQQLNRSSVKHRYIRYMKSNNRWYLIGPNKKYYGCFKTYEEAVQRREELNI